MSDVEKPDALAPKPAKRAAKKAVKKTAVKRAKSGADVGKLLARNRELLELVQSRRAEADGLQRELAGARDEVLLLRAGVNPRWTDEHILKALHGADGNDGPLGALLAILDREVAECRAQAEVYEDRGDMDRLPGYVRAGARLQAVRDKIIELHHRANHWSDEEPGKRASRYVDG